MLLLSFFTSANKAVFFFLGVVFYNGKVFGDISYRNSVLISHILMRLNSAEKLVRIFFLNR
jgi:hypothetical protein